MSVFLVKMPHKGISNAWCADDKAHFCALVEASNKSGDVIFEVKTVHEVRVDLGFENSNDVSFTDVRYRWLRHLMDNHKSDTLVQKTFMDTTYEIAAGIDLDEKRFQACLEFETHDLSGYEWFHTLEAAEEAVLSEEFWKGHNSGTARGALRLLLQRLGTKAWCYDD